MAKSNFDARKNGQVGAVGTQDNQPASLTFIQFKNNKSNGNTPST